MTADSMEPPETRPAETRMPAGAMAIPMSPASADHPWQERLRRDWEDVRSVLSPYPPIADYAFLSDCEVTTLIAPSGAVEWMCLPRMDSPSVFGAILDRDAGRFRFGPENVSARASPGLCIVRK